MTRKVNIIGAGISGLSAACYLAKNGFDVSIFEKNDFIGGRVGQIKHNNFIFDIGPSWYWMPDIIENFFNDFNKKPEDYYNLIKLNPGYRVFFSENNYIDIPDNLDDLFKLFESLEPGSSIKLKKFLADAEYKYKIGVHEAAMKIGNSIFDYFTFNILKGMSKLDLFKSVSKNIRQTFKHDSLIKILEFPVIFLGSVPSRMPSLYTLMNYADLVQGTWYPMGGMYKIIDGMVDIAKNFGVNFYLNSEVKNIKIKNNNAVSISINGKSYENDYIIASADYQHVDSTLLDKKYNNYSEKYWQSRELAPSAIVIYIGLNKKIKNLQHHNILFDANFEKHAEEIYNTNCWPTDPSIYVSCTSKTDDSVAPADHENLVILIPVSPGLIDNDDIKEKYYNIAINRIEKITNHRIEKNIVFKKIFASSDFNILFNAYKGNAYGLSNTLKQTGFLKPKMKSKKIKNLLYAGQLTVPGPGIPPVLLSGKIAANQILKNIQ